MLATSDAVERAADTAVSRPSTNVSETVPVGHAPELPVYDPTNGWVYEPNRGSNNISILNGTSIVGAIALNGSPVTAVVDTTNGWVYVATEPANSSSAWQVDVVNGSSVAATVDLGTHVFIVGSAFSPINRCVYEVSSSTENVSVLNGTSLVANLSVASEPGNPVFDPVNGNVYVPNTGASSVSELNGSAPNATGPVGTISVGPDPVGVVVDPINGFAYVINQWTGWNTGSVSVVNGSTVVATVWLAVDSYGYQPTQGYWDSSHRVVYVLTQGNFLGYYSAVEVIQGLNLTATDLASPRGFEPLQATFDPATGDLLVTNATGGPNLTLVSNTTIAGNLSTASGIQAGAFDPANGLLYLPLGAGDSSTNLTVLDGSAAVPSIATFRATPNPDPLNTTVAFDVNASGGVGGLSYDYTGLPSGCQSANTSSLTCIPRVPGSYRVAVQVSDPSGLSSTRGLSLEVLPMQINSFTAVPSTVEVGSPATGNTSLVLNLSGGIGPFTYTYLGLPPGCTSANVSPLRCAPNASSAAVENPTYYIWVNVTDAAGNYVGRYSDSVAMLVVDSAFAAAVNVSSRTVDVGESDQFTASPIGGSGSFTYSWLFGDGNASALPAVAHAYRATGNYTAQFWANDSLGGAVHRVFPIVVDPAVRVVLTVSNSSPTIGQSVQFNASPTGGAGSFSFVYLGLPPGCVSVDAPTIGCLPTQAGSYNVSVNATDPNAGAARASLAITVVFGFTVVSPSSAVVGQPITLAVQVATVAGTLAYGYAGLPPGCQSADSAQLTCTPTAPGQYAVEVTVTSSLYGPAHKVVPLRIVGDQGTTSPPLPAGNGGLLEGFALGGLAVGAIALAAFSGLRRGGRPAPPTEPRPRLD